MYELLMSEWLLFGGIILLMLLSIICQLMLIYHMVKLVKESESLEESNISVFVDKKIQQISIGKMTLIRWKHISGQLLLAMVFLSGCGACTGIIRGKTLGEILPYYIVSLLGVYFYISLSAIMDMEEKTNRIRMNVTDFLENGKAQEYRKKEEMERMEEIRKKVPDFSDEEDLELMDMIREILA